MKFEYKLGDGVKVRHNQEKAFRYILWGLCLLGLLSSFSLSFAEPKGLPNFFPSKKINLGTKLNCNSRKIYFQDNKNSFNLDIIPKWNVAMLPAKDSIRLLKTNDSYTIQFIGNTIYICANGDYKIRVKNQKSNKKKKYNNLPVIFSLAKNRYEGNKSKIEKLEVRKPRKEKYSYSIKRAYIENGKAIFKYQTNDRATELIQKIIPVIFVLNGKRWTGYRMEYEFGITNKFIGKVVEQSMWDFSKESADDKIVQTTWMNSPYGKERGAQKIKIGDSFFSKKLKAKNIFSSAQPFFLTSSAVISHLSFPVEPALLDTVLEIKNSTYKLSYESSVYSKQTVIKQKGYYHLFCEEEMSDDDYLGLLQAINKYYRQIERLPEPILRPIANAYKSNQINCTNRWSKYADKIIPKVKELGFKRVFAGIISKRQQFNFEYKAKQQDLNAIKIFCDKANAENIQSIMWIPSCTSSKKSTLLKNNPDWIFKNPNGSRAYYANKKDLLMIEPSKEYIGWLSNELHEAVSLTGINGLWIDSYELFTKLFYWQREKPADPYKDIIRTLKMISDENFSLYGEGLSPYIISSFWIRKDRYLSYQGIEYALYNTSPFTNRPDSDFIDYFKAVSYNVFPVFDIHPFIDDVNFYPDQKLLEKKIIKTNEAINFIHKVLGFQPEVHMFSHGVYWLSENGFSLFMHRHSDNIKLTLKNSETIQLFCCSAGIKKAVLEQKGNIIKIKNIPENSVIVVYNNEGE